MRGWVTDKHSVWMQYIVQIDCCCTFSFVSAVTAKGHCKSTDVYKYNAA